VSCSELAAGEVDAGDGNSIRAGDGGAPRRRRLPSTAEKRG